ncbi:MAG: hypothetical protein HKN23_14450, partial [Verrucomicrobiales bacterium]|nr:hypothetical protein [Verrucomicrobiales bacterium]
MKIIEILKISPKTVATVTTSDDLEFLGKHPDAAGGADLLEFRLDDLVGHLEDAELSISRSTLPIVLTPRHPGE